MATRQDTDDLIVACVKERDRLQGELEQLHIDREKLDQRECTIRAQIAQLAPYTLSIKLGVTTARVTCVTRAHRRYCAEAL